MVKYDWEVGKPPPPVEAHSEAKHRVLSHYLRRYIEIVAGPIQSEGIKLTLVDGFAGGGEYALPNGGITPGSPVIMINECDAAAVEQQLKRTKKFTLATEFIFIEKRRKSAAYLKDCIRRHGHGDKMESRIHIVNGEFENQVDDIIYRIRLRGTAHRSFFLLDQFGYNTASLSSVRRILNELENPEILLTFNVDYLIDYMARSPEFLKAVQPVGLSHAQVNELLFMKDQSGGRYFIQRYLLDHIVHETGAPQFTYFYIKSPESHRSYWLVHLSKHYLARNEMTQQHWDLKNHFINHTPSGLRMPGFDPDVNLNQGILDFNFDENADILTKNTLLDEIPRALFNVHKIDDSGIVVSDLFSRYGQYMAGTLQHLGSALATLRDEKETLIYDRHGKLKPRAKKVEWTDRIAPVKQLTLFGRSD